MEKKSQKDIENRIAKIKEKLAEKLNDKENNNLVNEFFILDRELIEIKSENKLKELGVK